MSVFKRAMDYLGLGPDDAYDDYDDFDDDEPPARPAPRQRAPMADDQRPAPRAARQPSFEEPAVRPSGPRAMPRSIPSSDFEQQPPARPRAMSLEDSSVQPRPRTGSSNNVVRMNPSSSSSNDTHTVKAVRFEHAQEIADKFKSGQSVIMNLESTERTESRRLIDFASGLCYGLSGSMEKVATGVYLLKPAAPRHDDPYSDYR